VDPLAGVVPFDQRVLCSEAEALNAGCVSGFSFGGLVNLGAVNYFNLVHAHPPPKGGGVVYKVKTNELTA